MFFGRVVLFTTNELYYRKNLSKNNSKSLSTLRQKMRKYLKDFEDEIAKFRENPDEPDDDEEEEEGSSNDSDSEEEEERPAAPKKGSIDVVPEPKAPKVGFKIYQL